MEPLPSNVDLIALEINPIENREGNFEIHTKIFFESTTPGNTEIIESMLFFLYFLVIRVVIHTMLDNVKLYSVFYFNYCFIFKEFYLSYFIHFKASP